MSPKQRGNGWKNDWGKMGKVCCYGLWYYYFIILCIVQVVLVFFCFVLVVMVCIIGFIIILCSGLSVFFLITPQNLLYHNLGGSGKKIRQDQSNYIYIYNSIHASIYLIYLSTYLPTSPPISLTPLALTWALNLASSASNSSSQGDLKPGGGTQTFRT